MIQYRIVSNFTLSSDQMESLMCLYQPLFQHPAANLYLTLVTQAKYEEKISRRKLLRLLHIDEEELHLLRKELEKMHLVRTFQSDTLEIEIIAPKIPSDFLSHDLFSRLYVVVCGQSEYANALQRYGKKTITDNLEEISQSFDINRIAAWDEDIEAMYKEEQGKHHQQTEFNIRNFFKSFPLFPNKLISSDVKRAVVESATLYKISASDMKSILLETIEYNKEIFDMRRFLNIVAKKHGVQSVSMVDNVYDLDPISFLGHIQEFEASTSDKYLIKSLQKRYQFENPVINLLIQTMMDSESKSMNLGFAQSIADPWKRLGVETFEDAEKALKSFQDKSIVSKKPRFQPVKTQTIQPVYSTEEEFDDEELKRLREELGINRDKEDA